MKLWRMLLAGAVLTGTLVTTTGAADPNKEPTKEDLAKAEIRGAAVSDLALAAELAAFGRDAKSPESLVIAGGMLLRANKTFGGKTEALDTAPVDDKGNPIKAAAMKAVPLDKQAEALFDEARATVATDKARGPALEALITNAKKFEFGTSAETRPSVGGANTITRQLNPGETHTYPIAFFSGQQAAVAMTSSGPARIQFDITHVGGNNLFSLKGLNANYNWVPAGGKKDNVRKFNITLTNMGNRVTTYTLATN